MKFTGQLFIAIFIVALIACVDRYDPKLTGETPYIVFEGILTDQAGPHYFNLSNSAGYNSKESIFDRTINAAKVWITDAKNVRTDLIDLSKGKFSTPEGFRGQIGNAYTLHVINAGIEYASSAETMRLTPPIEKVYTEYKPNNTLKAQYRGFFNVFIDTKDPATEGDYYRWTWTHYQRASFCEVWRMPGSPYLFYKYCCDDCWEINECIGCINMASDNLINGRTLAKQQILQAPYDDISPYYLVIKQMSLSKEAYNYWASVEAQTNNSGGIFDVAPAQIKGNIKNQNDKTSPMLGYFQVSAVTQKIVHIQRNNVNLLPYRIAGYPYRPMSECIPCQESLYRTKIKPQNWID